MNHNENASSVSTPKSPNEMAICSCFAIGDDPECPVHKLPAPASPAAQEPITEQGEAWNDEDEARAIATWNHFDDVYAAALRAFKRLRASVAQGQAEADSERFQSDVKNWVIECFGEDCASDRVERNHRFVEEALETVQANGCSREDAHRLVDYVFDRPVGYLHQEVGGALVTLAALCAASGINMKEAGRDELHRITEKKEQVRAKRLAKLERERSLRSPLP